MKVIRKIHLTKAAVKLRKVQKKKAKAKAPEKHPKRLPKALPMKVAEKPPDRSRKHPAALQSRTAPCPKKSK